MYNFSGIAYRIWGMCGIIFLLSLAAIVLFGKPWRNDFKISKYKVELFAMAFAVCLGCTYLFRIIFPDVSSYTGEFVESYRTSRVAPPLPFTSKYVFWNGEGKKKVVYLDTFSKKQIVPDGFKPGEEYTVYFDEFTKVIVRVEHK